MTKTNLKSVLPGIAILLAGAVWIWLSAAPGEQTTAGLIPAPQAGFLAPDFTLENAGGVLITLSDFRGKPVLVNLWASWCGPCRQEMPAIQRTFDAYKARGFTVLAVNVTSQDSEAAAMQFVEEHELTFPILLDRTGEVAALYENRALPSSFFVDPNGVIREVIIGGPMAEALLASRVQQLLTSGEK